MDNLSELECRMSNEAGATRQFWWRSQSHPDAVLPAGLDIEDISWSPERSIAPRKALQLLRESLPQSVALIRGTVGVAAGDQICRIERTSTNQSFALKPRHVVRCDGDVDDSLPVSRRHRGVMLVARLKIDALNARQKAELDNAPDWNLSVVGDEQSDSGAEKGPSRKSDDFLKRLLFVTQRFGPNERRWVVENASAWTALDSATWNPEAATKWLHDTRKRLVETIPFLKHPGIEFAADCGDLIATKIHPFQRHLSGPYEDIVVNTNVATKVTRGAVLRFTACPAIARSIGDVVRRALGGIERTSHLPSLPASDLDLAPDRLIFFHADAFDSQNFSEIWHRLDGK
jgi:hypothetical protein